MSDSRSSDFETLLAAARTGDPDAIAQIVQQYEPEVRIVARLRLSAPLRPHLDSIDLVQSVHRSLIAGLRDNRFDISSPQNLIALALTIVRRKAARKWRKARRQQSLANADPGESSTFDVFANLQAPDGEPRSGLELRDYAQRLLDQLAPSERELIELRIEGLSTVEAARRMGLDPDALRVKLSRLRKRLRAQGWDDTWL